MFMASMVGKWIELRPLSITVLPFTLKVFSIGRHHSISNSEMIGTCSYLKDPIQQLQHQQSGFIIIEVVSCNDGYVLIGDRDSYTPYFRLFGSIELATGDMTKVYTCLCFEQMDCICDAAMRFFACDASDELVIFAKLH